MVRLNVIYTRTGDAGESGLGDGTRRPKTDARFAAMGDVDETNCAVGLARLHAQGATDPALAAIEATLERMQNDLFDLGADLCLPPPADEKPGAALRVAASQVEALERAIDALNAKLDPLRSFILPGGTAASAALHHARAVCRRAERSVVALAAIEGEEVGARRARLCQPPVGLSVRRRARRQRLSARTTCFGRPAPTRRERR